MCELKMCERERERTEKKAWATRPMIHNSSWNNRAKTNTQNVREDYATLVFIQQHQLNPKSGKNTKNSLYKRLSISLQKYIIAKPVENTPKNERGHCNAIPLRIKIEFGKIYAHTHTRTHTPTTTKISKQNHKP